MVYLCSIKGKNIIYEAFSNNWFKDGFACFNICGHENVGEETALCAHRSTVVFLLIVLSIKLEIIFFEN